ncbi:putative baseplate assembly protein [Nocardia sp. XZ_19_231]|uniref:putative baseplate assembly protein n=1 Tax=Nocardia sp. XZ_19_231 TaxID=2769252 RepID=UPI00188E6617|nr:putative baseplate assembly protein [Nocardia sp. XZ_19_231]
MRARLSAAEYPGLAGLRTHDIGDPSVALLDALAVVGDVLTFYQERVANEGYLRTATERRSIVELARLIGYIPRPGVAASVYLAYTVAEGAEPVTIPKGARASSVPGPGEEMQAFETSDDLEARTEWSTLRIRRTWPQTVESIFANGLYLAGTATNLHLGDALLINIKPPPGLPVPVRVGTVEPDDGNQRTRVTLREWVTGADFARILRQELAPFRELTRFGIAHDGAVAVRALDALDAMDREVSGDSTPTRVAAAASDALAALRPERDAARASHFGRLVPWLSGMIGVLTRVSEFATASSSADQGIGGTDLPATGIDDIVAPLRLPPSFPPRTSAHLARSSTTAFAAGSDVYPSLLSSGTPSLYSALANLPVTEPSPLVVEAMRRAAPLFGHNAPRQPQYEPWFFEDGEDDVGDDNDGQEPNPLAGQPKSQPWDEWDLDRDTESSETAFLDAAYPSVAVGTPVIVQRTDDDVRWILSEVATATTFSRSAYGLSAQTTRLTFTSDWWKPKDEDGEDGDGFDVIRGTTVYCRSERLELAEEPIRDDVVGGEVELDGLYEGLRSGRWVIVSGERTDVPGTSGVRASELVMIAGVRHGTSFVTQGDSVIRRPGDTLHTYLTFAEDLAYRYKRDTVVMHGNVVHATHGETRREVLGGGDATASLQTFALKQSPLTLTSAPTTSGVASSLEVRVADVQWYEADSLLALGPAGRGFITSIDDTGKTSVTFGNGRHGARLPTGFDNITATYRTGIGGPGNVRPNQISLPATKPLGVTGVDNPIRASGGAGPESRDDARRNAPLAVLALDRLVGIGDYADFARTFAGIGKAVSVRLSDGVREVVHVTIAGAGDAPVDHTSDLYANLRIALRRHGDPFLPIQVAVRELLVIALSANVGVLPDYRWETIEPALRAALLADFGFDRRELGQDLVPSMVLATMQAVPGVEYVDLNVLTAIDEARIVDGIRSDGSSLVLPGVDTVRVLPARFVDRRILSAQLAYLQPSVRDTLILNEVRA